jgi:hypothetical protein
MLLLEGVALTDSGRPVLAPEELELRILEKTDAEFGERRGGLVSAPDELDNLESQTGPIIGLSLGIRRSDSGPTPQTEKTSSSSPRTRRTLREPARGARVPRAS